MSISYRVGDCGKSRSGRDYCITMIDSDDEIFPVASDLFDGEYWHRADGTSCLNCSADDLMPPTHNTDGTRYEYNADGHQVAQAPQVEVTLRDHVHTAGVTAGATTAPVERRPYQVGDKVRAIKSWHGVLPYGVGTIVSLIAFTGVEVDFPEWEGGHDGSAGHTNGVRSRWKYWGDEVRDCLELVEAVKECPTCEPAGVMATDGSGPLDCYDCGKEAPQFKVGDRVRIARKVEWDGWMPGMNEHIGATDTVRDEYDNGEMRCMLLFGWWFPVAALELVTDEPQRVEAVERSESLEVFTHNATSFGEAFASSTLQIDYSAMRDDIARELLPLYAKRLGAVLDAGNTIKEGETFDSIVVTWAFDTADAYMAERARRRGE